MTLFQRAHDIIQAKANKALDAAEKPDEMLDLSYQQMLDHLTEVRRALVEIAASRKRIELQEQQLAHTVEHLDDAARAALGLGARVTVLDVRAERLVALEAMLLGLETLPLHGVGLRELLPGTDLLIGAALIPGEHAPHSLERAMIASMPEGAVFVDVSIDQGGISETSRPTSFEAPAYVEAGVIHCCLPNLPAVVPLSSTLALTHATFPYVQRLASGIAQALGGDSALRHGVNVWEGKIRHAGVAEALGLPYAPWPGEGA